jgi:hypothetical protein
MEGYEMKNLKYRMLREGEHVKAGDQYRSLSFVSLGDAAYLRTAQNWKPVEISDIGIVVTGQTFTAREYRRLEQ